MLKLEEEPPLQSAKEQALGPPPQEIWEPGHGVHLLVVIHILLVKPDQKYSNKIYYIQSLTHALSHAPIPSDRV